MIIKPENNNVGYRCPECGRIVLGMVGVFQLTASMIKLKCTNHDSEMEIIYTKDKKIKFKVPCFFCDTTHTFTISKDTFFNREKDLLTLSCPLSGFNILYIGDSEAICNEFEKDENELTQMISESENTDASINDITKINRDNRAPSSPETLETILSALDMLLEENAVECDCGVPEECDIYVQQNKVKIKCKKCNCSASFQIDSVAAADKLLKADNLRLNKNRSKK